MTLLEKAVAAIAGAFVAVKGAGVLLDKKSKTEDTAPVAGTSTSTVEATTTEAKSEETPSEEKTEQ